MADVRSAWTEAGEKFSALGQKLKQHYDEERESDSETPQQQAASQDQVKHAVRRLGVAVEDVFDAMSKAAKDGAVKEDAKQAGQSLAGALSATFAEVSDELRKAFSGATSRGDAGASTPESPVPETPSGQAPGADTSVVTEQPRVADQASTPEGPPA
jgi:hypothetical protein